MKSSVTILDDDFQCQFELGITLGFMIVHEYDRFLNRLCLFRLNWTEFEGWIYYGVEK